MTTSGTYSYAEFNNIGIIETALARIEIDVMTAKHLQESTRTLNLMLLDWSNDDINMWALNQINVAMQDGVSEYTLDSEILDVTEGVLRDTTGATNVDTIATRISRSEYLQRPNKSDEGTPLQFALERNQAGGQTLYVWPTPSESSRWTLQLLAIRAIQETSNLTTQGPDIPLQFMNALVLGLAYNLRYLNPRLEVNKIIALKEDYTEAYNKVKNADRERTSFFVLPDVRLR